MSVRAFRNQTMILHTKQYFSTNYTFIFFINPEINSQKNDEIE